jgi:energy-converting hydrogenase Eha subunit F
VLAVLSLLLVLEHQPILAFTGSSRFSGILKTCVLVCVALIVVQLLAGIMLRRHWVPPRGVPGRQLVLGLLDWLIPYPRSGVDGTTTLL